MLPIHLSTGWKLLVVLLLLLVLLLLWSCLGPWAFLRMRRLRKRLRGDRGLGGRRFWGWRSFRGWDGVERRYLVCYGGMCCSGDWRTGIKIVLYLDLSHWAKVKIIYSGMNTVFWSQLTIIYLALIYNILFVICRRNWLFHHLADLLFIS